MTPARIIQLLCPPCPDVNRSAPVPGRCGENMAWRVGVPTTVVVATLQRPGTGALRSGSGAQGASLGGSWNLPATTRAFSLIEVLIAVTLMSVIVLGLLTMFSQTQKAFRTGITQVDVMESGRAAIEMMTRELEQMRPTGLSNSVSFYAGWNNYFMLQKQPGDSLSGNAQFRTNIQQNILFTTRENQTWTGIGYTVIWSNYLGTLYRYETNAAQGDTAQIQHLAVNAFNAATSKSRIADGVVSLRVLAYDDKGYLITPYYTPTGAVNSVFVTNNIPGEISYEYTFRSNAVPAYLDLELGILEAKTADRARPLPVTPVDAQGAYLEKQAGHVQVFRQRIPIRNVDTSVYQ
jgi:prepilin-type N-terminal cleavage/methylation domain-containing protein